MTEFYLSLCLGFSLGILFCQLYSETNLYRIGIYRNRTKDPRNVRTVSPKHGPIGFNDAESLYHKEGDRVAKELSRNIRILCWVMTQPKNLQTKAQAVKDTWGKRCNILLFMSSEEDKNFTVVPLHVSEGRDNLWLKTRAAWKYVYENHFNDADWFIKVDDDTFVVIENLRYLLSNYSTSDPHFFGRYFAMGYNSGGAGYVFSKETLIRFMSVMKDPFKCKLTSPNEDVEVGICLAAVDVHPGDTRDELGRETFHPLPPYKHLIPGYITKDNWLHTYDKWKVQVGRNCCSDYSVSFHYITPEDMYVMEYFVYNLHAFGLYQVHD